MARGRRAPKRGRVGRAPARAMARGGRTRPRPAPRGRGRKMPGGGSTCGGMNQPPCPGGGYRRGGRPRPVPRRMARGGRTRPVPRRMARGGRPVRRRMPHGGRIHGQSVCPAGTFRTADGRCTKMGS